MGVLTPEERDTLTKQLVEARREILEYNHFHPAETYRPTKIYLVVYPAGEGRLSGFDWLWRLIQPIYIQVRLDPNGEWGVRVRFTHNAGLKRLERQVEKELLDIIKTEHHAA